MTVNSVGRKAESRREMPVDKAPVGVMLVNFGVPQSPDEADVEKFLRSYVVDRRSFGRARVIADSVLHSRRRRRYLAESVARYVDLYDGDHFPYTRISENLRRKVVRYLDRMGADNVVVESAFRYGEPSMRDGFKNLEEAGCKRILILPLYPQSSYEFTASVHDEYLREQRSSSSDVELKFVDNFYADPGYIAAVADSIREAVDVDEGEDKIVFVYRTIPAKDIEHGDSYELQTAMTSLAVAQSLGLERRMWTIAYLPYNHLRLSETLEPDIDEAVERFGIGGVRNIAVVCPGQVVDSVDTLYEIDERMRERFERQFVGDSERCSFTYIDSLNDGDMFAEALAGIAIDNMGDWEDDLSRTGRQIEHRDYVAVLGLDIGGTAGADASGSGAGESGADGAAGAGADVAGSKTGKAEAGFARDKDAVADSGRADAATPADMTGAYDASGVAGWSGTSSASTASTASSSPDSTNASMGRPARGAHSRDSVAAAIRREQEEAERTAAGVAAATEVFIAKMHADSADSADSGDSAEEPLDLDAILAAIPDSAPPSHRNPHGRRSARSADDAGSDIASVRSDSSSPASGSHIADRSQRSGSDTEVAKPVPVPDTERDSDGQDAGTATRRAALLNLPSLGSDDDSAAGGDA